MKNILEDIVSDFLDDLLALKFDICTCKLCKEDMLAYVLSRLPPKYTTTEEESFRAIVEQTKAENQTEIDRLILQAIKKVKSDPRHQLKEDPELIFKMLLNKIFQDRGLDFRHYRQELLKRRFALRIRANNVKSYSEYLRLLIHKPEEYDKLFESLTINVTEFFRDPGVWISIKTLCKDLIKHKLLNGESTIKVWSAGCSSGAEGYSMAILLSDLLKPHKQISVEIVGTDIDLKSLETATNGEYEKGVLNNINPEYLQNYFELKDERYQASEEIKKLVKFKNLDLIAADYFKNIDIVLCRNVFIYFDRSLQDMLLTKFYDSLTKSGYLILGKVENIMGDARKLFGVINQSAKIYQKKDIKDIRNG